jgi:C4-dicarboxylate-specific signal transduction histidine kinase
MTARGAAERSIGPGVLAASALPGDLFHELGNLLATLRLAAHVVAPTGRSRAPDALQAEIEPLAALAGAQLAQLRLLQGLRHVQRSRVATRVVLEALARAIGERPRAGVELSVTRPRSLPDVRVDPELVHVVLVSLTLQAVEASAPRSVGRARRRSGSAEAGTSAKVRVSARRAGREVVLVLQDSGPPLGFDPRDAASLRSGRALGLRSAHAVLRRSGGRLRFAPTPRGNRVHVHLPTPN